MRYTSKDWETECESGNLRRIPRVLIMPPRMPEEFTFDEAIEYLMRSQGVSRRKARRMLVDAQASGKVRVTGISPATKKREVLPAGALKSMRDSDLYPLSADEAAAKLYADPESVFMTPLDIMHQLGFSAIELTAELRSGRMKARGIPTDYGYRDVVITIGEITRWMTNPEAPEAVRNRVWEHLHGHGTRQ